MNRQALRNGADAVAASAPLLFGAAERLPGGRSTHTIMRSLPPREPSGFPVLQLRSLRPDHRRAAAGSEPLQEDQDVFWANPLPALADADLGTAEIPKIHAPLPKQLGRFPFWQGNKDLAAALEEIYAAASQRAAMVYLDQAEPNLADNPEPP